VTKPHKMRLVSSKKSSMARPRLKRQQTLYQASAWFGKFCQGIEQFWQVMRIGNMAESVRFCSG